LPLLVDPDRGFGRGFDRDELLLVRPDVRERARVEEPLLPDVLRDRDGEVRVATLAGYVLVPLVTRVTRRRPSPFGPAPRVGGADGVAVRRRS
jgi:hypothetical protein